MFPSSTPRPCRHTVSKPNTRALDCDCAPGQDDGFYFFVFFKLQEEEPTFLFTGVHNLQIFGNVGTGVGIRVGVHEAELTIVTRLSVVREDVVHCAGPYRTEQWEWQRLLKKKHLKKIIVIPFLVFLFLSNSCCSTTFWSLHVWADLVALSSVESRLDVDDTFVQTVEDGSGALAHQRRHETYSRKEQKVNFCFMPFADIKFVRRCLIVRCGYHHEVEEAQVLHLKEGGGGKRYQDASRSEYYLSSAKTSEATCLTSPLADVPSFVFTVVVVPVAVVDDDGQAVFTVVVVRVTCEVELRPGEGIQFTRSSFIHTFSRARMLPFVNWPAFQLMNLKGEPSIHSQPPSVTESWPPIHREIPVGLCWITPERKHRDTRVY